MKEKLPDIACALNTYHAKDGTTFGAVLSEDRETVEVTCSENPDFPIILSITDAQILAVTVLFKAAV